MSSRPGAARIHPVRLLGAVGIVSRSSRSRNRSRGHRNGCQEKHVQLRAHRWRTSDLPRASALWPHGALCYGAAPHFQTN